MLAMHNTNAFDATAKNVSWDSIRKCVSGKMNLDAFNSWILPLSGSVDGNVLTLNAANQFSVDFINRTFIHSINAAATEFGLTVNLCVRAADVSDDSKSVNDNVSQKNWVAPVSPKKSAPIGFDDFIMSDENVFAVNACKKLAAGAVTFSPLFIYGNAGSGKSMLSRIVANCASGRVVHMTGAGFVSEFVRAMNTKTTFAFKDFVRNCDTFILDDVGQIAGKRACSEEFMITIVDLIRSGKNVMLTANGAPSQLSGFERGLQSVFASGLSIDLTAPNASVRRQILARSGVPAALAQMISERTSDNGHVVAGVAKKIRTYTELMGENVSFEIANRLIADVIGEAKTPIVMVKNMCSKLGVSFDDVLSPSRNRGIVRARMIMMCALKTATKLPLAEIGRLMGDRDHATVLYGLSQIEKMKSTDLILNAEIEQMIGECK